MPTDFKDTSPPSDTPSSSDVPTSNTGLSDAGMSALQGESANDVDPMQGTDSQGEQVWITQHSRQGPSPEFQPNVETEPKTIDLTEGNLSQLNEGNLSQPPEGWRPGGPEGR
jgi:hypothetical protein